MPIFEYRCRDCNKKFEAIVSASSGAICPKCSGKSLDKLLSVFAVGSEGSSTPSETSFAGGCGSCGDPRGPGACALD